MSDSFVTEEETSRQPQAEEAPRPREEKRSEERRPRREERGERDRRDDRDYRDERDTRSRDDRDYDRRDDRDRDRQRDDHPTFDDLPRIQGRASIGGVSDAALAVFMETFDKSKAVDAPNIPEEAKLKKFKLVPIDTSISGMENPALLVCLPVTIGKSMVLTYILLIEKDGEPTTRNMTDRGEPYDAILLPEDQLNKDFLEIVADQVSIAGPGDLVVVGSQVILADTVATLLSEKDSVKRIEAIFDNALGAVSGYRETMVESFTTGGKRSADKRINPKFMGRNSRMEVSFDYSGKQVIDTSGLPIRSDVTTMLFYSGAPRDRDSFAPRKLMGEVRAGLDLFVSYEENEDEGPRFGGRRSRRRDERGEPFWQAVLNINSIISGPGMPYSLEMAQLLMAQIAHQSNDYRWATILRPRTSLAGGMEPLMDLKYLHLLNPDKDLVGIYDDVTPNINDEDLGKFLDDTVHPEVALGLTVPSSGEKSWVLSVYERIATLPKESRARDKAIDQLYDSADILTNRYFREELDRLAGERVSPVRSTGTRIFLGYWTDEKGNKRDLREWNVPAFLAKVGEKKIELVQDFQATFEDTRYSLDKNLGDRYAIMKRVIPGMHVTGTCEQLALNPVYIGALNSALDLVNMSPIMSSYDGLNVRRRSGTNVYRGYTTTDIGVARRGRDDAGSRRRRGGIFGGDYY